MNVVRLKVQRMTREAFAPFGVLIDSRGSVEIDLGEGQPSLTGATSEWRPLQFDFLARQGGRMRVFSPLAWSPFVIAVALPGAGPAPDVERIVAFLVDGRQPYAYHK